MAKKKKIIFSSKMKDGSVKQIESIYVFEYIGEKFAYHKREAEEAKTFSVSHIATGICIDPGFGYENIKEAISGTELYIDTVGKEEFLDAIKDSK